MARFQYTARNLEGKSVEAVEDAPSEEALERILDSQGLRLISATELQPGQKAKRSLANFDLAELFAPTLEQQELILFTMELGTSYRAGLPILGTLDDMAVSAEAASIRRICSGLADRVRQGESLAESMAAYPKAFPTLYVELVSAAEDSGQLDRVLTDLVAFLEWQKLIRSQVLSATTYPAILFGVSILLVVVLSVFVFPQFIENFAGFGAELPMPTRVLMNVGDFGEEHGATVMMGLVAAAVVFFFIRNIPAVRWNIDMAKLKIPALGPLLTEVLMSRFTHNLSMMLASGLEFSHSLRICERIMGNVVLAKLVADARLAIEEGEALSDALAKGNYIPSLVRRMLKLGESTGNMEETLEHVSQFYDDEVPRAIKSAFAVIQPAILVFMAGAVLFMAAAVFMPIYQMLELLGDS